MVLLFHKISLLTNNAHTARHVLLQPTVRHSEVVVFSVYLYYGDSWESIQKHIGETKYCYSSTQFPYFML